MELDSKFTSHFNKLSKMAFQDAKAGRLEGPIDTSSVTAMLKSMGLAESTEKGDSELFKK